MKVGVVIPCHNYGHWLNDAIRSVLDQTYEQKKIVISVCDDGSQDNTSNVVQSYGNKIIFSRHEQPLGPSAARNTAIANCINDVDVIALLDADDIMHPTKLEILTHLFQMDDVGAVYADTQNLVEERYLIREFREPFNMRRAIQENIGLNNTSLVRVKALNSGMLSPNEWFDNSLRTCEDYDLFLRISNNWLIVHYPECLTTLRVHGNNSTASVSQSRWSDDRRRVIERFLNAKQSI